VAAPFTPWSETQLLDETGLSPIGISISLVQSPLRRAGLATGDIAPCDW